MFLKKISAVQRFSVGNARFKVPLCVLGKKMVYFEKALFMLGGTPMVGSSVGIVLLCYSGIVV